MPIDQQVFVLRCEATGSVVVVAPTEATEARLWHDDEQIGRFPLTDGVAVVPAPQQRVTVEVLDGSGRTLDQRAPMGTADIGN
jgi:hypothetical protein